MKPSFDPMASPAIIVPSMTACGSSRKMMWSLQVPGSDSSPLTRTYFDFCRREVFVEVVVDLDGRGPAARADAFDLFERERAVSSDFFVPDAKRVFAVVEDLIAAAQHAGDVGADLHVIFPGRFGAEHR